MIPEHFPQNDPKLEMKAILDDTVKFYSQDPEGRRAVIHGECSYADDMGNKCAVGRFLTEEDIKNLGEKGMLENTSFFDIIPEIKSDRILNLPRNFWADLQEFHDLEENWNDGITMIGEQAVAKIEERISSGYYFQ